MTKNKKIIIIASSAVVLLLILISVWIFFAKSKQSSNNPLEPNKNNSHNLPAIEYLNEAEKNKLGVSPETKIQALGRDENGEVTVYKVIKSESDVVTDPAKVEAVSPRDANQKK